MPPASKENKKDPNEQPLTPAQQLLKERRFKLSRYDLGISYTLTLLTCVCNKEPVIGAGKLSRHECHKLPSDYGRRRRRIKCDEGHPCQACITASSACTFEEPGKRTHGTTSHTKAKFVIIFVHGSDYSC